MVSCESVVLFFNFVICLLFYTIFYVSIFGKIRKNVLIYRDTDDPIAIGPAQTKQKSPENFISFIGKNRLLTPCRDYL